MSHAQRFIVTADLNAERSLPQYELGRPYFAPEEPGIITELSIKDSLMTVEDCFVTAKFTQPRADSPNQPPPINVYAMTSYMAEVLDEVVDSLGTVSALLAACAKSHDFKIEGKHVELRLEFTFLTGGQCTLQDLKMAGCRLSEYLDVSDPDYDTEDHWDLRPLVLPPDLEYETTMPAIEAWFKVKPQ